MIKPPMTTLIIGPSGHGKTWLSSTAPPPRLIVDLEGRARYTPNGRGATDWDGMSDPMQLEKSPTRTYILRTRDLEKMDTARQWLRTGKHPFFSFTADSLMEAQLRKVESLRGRQAMRIQDFGELLRSMQVFIREMRDMVNDGIAGPLRVVTFVAGAQRDDDGYIRPLMQGRIARDMSYWLDVVGYLEKVRLDNGNVMRRLWLDQRPENDLEVKDGLDYITQKLGPCITLPDVRNPAAGGSDLTTIYECLPGAVDEGGAA
jgi:hypothetical protein